MTDGQPTVTLVMLDGSRRSVPAVVVIHDETSFREARNDFDMPRLVPELPDYEERFMETVTGEWIELKR